LLAQAELPLVAAVVPVVQQAGAGQAADVADEVDLQQGVVEAFQLLARDVDLPCAGSLKFSGSGWIAAFAVPPMTIGAASCAARVCVTLAFIAGRKRCFEGLEDAVVAGCATATVRASPPRWRLR
jgi:hypothetical protein